MTLGDLLKVNNINNIVIFVPDPQFPNSFGMCREKHYTCAGREVLMDKPGFCKLEVSGLFLSPENQLQILLKPEEKI